MSLSVQPYHQAMHPSRRLPVCLAARSWSQGQAGVGQSSEQLESRVAAHLAP